ncbi:hypothetical protein L208DRAFT_1323075 [Tricholoma matsutake]|nr:hypothetical protein L208DRAFT_1323075 [Tricholoma matsutake 945]
MSQSNSLAQPVAHAQFEPTYSELACDHQSCRQSFSSLAALNFHKQSCQPSKKRLRGALSVAKELFAIQKKRRIEAAANISTPTSGHCKFCLSESEQLGLLTVFQETLIDNNPELLPFDPNDKTPLAIRQTRWIGTLPPVRYCDIRPQPPPPLGKVNLTDYMFLYLISRKELAVPVPDTSSESSETAVAPQSMMLRYFCTPRNIFGLSRKFYGLELPFHDPEAYTSQELCDVQSDSCSTGSLATHPNPSPNDQPFYPYPNQDAFNLGDWYWNHGVQKSQENFKHLLEIVGNLSFSPSNIQKTNWTEIDTLLAANKGDSYLEDDQWLGEDTGWTHTAISIRVPFHHRMKISGLQWYLAGELYHRSIIAVIRERLSRGLENFHFQPYELLWKHSDHEDEPDIRIHGELYSSAAFLKAHKALLDSPPNPGCIALRVIIALMFWSDETVLTSFGKTKLWPCYMYFGNESKYQRMKPSCNLANHIAYFEVV